MPKQDKEKAKMWYFGFFDTAHIARENKRETRFSVRKTHRWKQFNGGFCIIQ